MSPIPLVSLPITALNVHHLTAVMLIEMIPASIMDLIPNLDPGLSTWDLIMIGVRTVGLISIIHFVRSRITSSTLATITTLVLAYLLLFRWATLFLPVLVLVIFLPHGPLNLIFDIALGGGGAGPEEAKKKKSQKKRTQRKRMG